MLLTSHAGRLHWDSRKSRHFYKDKFYNRINSEELLVSLFIRMNNCCTFLSGAVTDKGSCWNIFSPTAPTWESWNVAYPLLPVASITVAVATKVEKNSFFWNCSNLYRLKGSLNHPYKTEKMKHIHKSKKLLATLG